MTICIAANFESFIVIVADTRTTLGRPAISYTDGKQKLHKSPIGLLAGSGWVELLEAVIARICESSISNSMDIKNIIIDEVASIEDSSTQNNLEFIQSTGWLYSYETLQDSQLVLRLGFHHGSSIDQYHDMHPLIPAGSGCVWIDAQYTEDASVRYTQYLVSLLEGFDSDLSGSEKLEKFLITAQNLVAHTSYCYDSVSQEFTLGIHSIGGEYLIEGPVPVVAAYNEEIANDVGHLEEQAPKS